MKRGGGGRRIVALGIRVEARRVRIHFPHTRIIWSRGKESAEKGRFKGHKTFVSGRSVGILRSAAGFRIEFEIRQARPAILWQPGVKCRSAAAAGGLSSGKRRENAGIPGTPESAAEGVIGSLLRPTGRDTGCGRDRSIPFSIWTVAERSGESHRSVLSSAVLPPSPSPGTTESCSTPTRGFAAVSLQLVASLRLPRHR